MNVVNNTAVQYTTTKTTLVLTVSLWNNLRMPVPAECQVILDSAAAIDDGDGAL